MRHTTLVHRASSAKQGQVAVDRRPTLFESIYGLKSQFKAGNSGGLAGDTTSQMSMPPTTLWATNSFWQLKQPSPATALPSSQSSAAESSTPLPQTPSFLHRREQP